MDRKALLQVISDSFPSSIEPIHLGAPILSFLQLGYGLWLVLFVVLLVLVLKPAPLGCGRAPWFHGLSPSVVVPDPGNRPFSLV